MPSAVRSSRSHTPRPAATQARTQARLQLWIPALLMFLSGGAALVYQVLWVKQLSLVVGVEVYAITTAISAFFAGLAFGGLAFGRWADRLHRPVVLYAGLELLVAALGLGATLCLGQAAGVCARLEASVGARAWMLPFVLVGLPAFFMGGTLPVLVRALAPDTDQMGLAGGGL